MQISYFWHFGGLHKSHYLTKPLFWKYEFFFIENIWSIDQTKVIGWTKWWIKIFFLISRKSKKKNIFTCKFWAHGSVKISQNKIFQKKTLKTSKRSSSRKIKNVFNWNIEAKITLKFEKLRKRIGPPILKKWFSGKTFLYVLFS